MLLNHLSLKHHLQLRCGWSLPISGSPLIAPNIHSAKHARTQTSTRTKQTGWSYWNQNRQSLQRSLMLSSNTTCIVRGTTRISLPVLLFSQQMAYVCLSRRASLFQHFFGIEFYHDGHTYIQAISTFEFACCFNLIESIQYHLSHERHTHNLDASTPAKTSAWVFEQVLSHLIFVRDSNCEVFLPNQCCTSGNNSNSG